MALLTLSPPPIFVDMGERSENLELYRRKPVADLKAELQETVRHPYITSQGLSTEPEAGESGAGNQGRVFNQSRVVLCRRP